MVGDHSHTGFDILARSDLIITVGLGLCIAYGLFYTDAHMRDAQSHNQKHDHRMEHNHTDDATAVQYGRVSTGTPSYLSGIGGWY